MGQQVFDGLYTSIGYEQVTALSTAAGLASIPAASNGPIVFALLQCTGATLRWRDDDTVPTASVGMRLIRDTDGIWYAGDDLTRLSFIQETATGILNVTYYRPGG